MEKIRNEFKVYLLNEEGLQKARDLSRLFSDFLSEVEELCGVDAPREMAIVKTKLQEAAFFAKRAIALDLDNQKGR